MSNLTPPTPELLLRANHQAWHSELNILAPNSPPPTHVTRHPPPPPHLLAIDTVLEQASVIMQLQADCGLTEDLIIPVPALTSSTSPGIVYVSFSRDSSEEYAIGLFQCTLNFVSKELDSLTGEPEDEGYENEYQSEDVELSPVGTTSYPVMLSSHQNGTNYEQAAPVQLKLFHRCHGVQKAQDLPGYLEDVAEHGKAQGITDTLSLGQLAIDGAPPHVGRLWTYLVASASILERWDWDNFKALVTLQYPEIEPIEDVRDYFDEFYAFLDESHRSELSSVPALGAYLRHFQVLFLAMVTRNALELSHRAQLFL
ncbi:hypothetical protein PISMIDRAFT_19107 [Pisolithus microcarpus 441]|uniref:Coatomer gamma subunit appendage Ig-like subdomain domain-containing protein n=1 Tax=Pisolithus microcarpus 441 TaxID=765257 RepID=A0A0C9XI18_9AGAM|nr:hypothetical protein PISMIDRAFT_19107 [Pisolithus microcarpus 441]